MKVAKSKDGELPVIPSALVIVVLLVLLLFGLWLLMGDTITGKKSLVEPTVSTSSSPNPVVTDSLFIEDTKTK